MPSSDHRDAGSLLDIALLEGFLLQKQQGITIKAIAMTRNMQRERLLLSNCFIYRPGIADIILLKLVRSFLRLTSMVTSQFP